MRKGLIFPLLVLFIPGILTADLTLLKPSGGETLIRGAQYHVEWWGPASEGSQKVTVFLESAGGGQFWILDDTHNKADGGFIWTVGHTQNGSVVPPGQYTITLESLDGDALGKTIFTILAPVSPYWARIKGIGKIPKLPPEPWCRNCFRLDLRELKQILGQPREGYVLSLFQGSLLLARLGEFGAGKSLPDMALVKVGRRPLRKRLPKQAYSLKFFNQKGLLLHSQDVLLIEKE